MPPDPTSTCVRNATATTTLAFNFLPDYLQLIFMAMALSTHEIILFLS